MSLFKKKNKTENISIDSATCTEEGKMVERPEKEIKPILKTEEKPEEEWVWVEGFKGLDYKMCGHGDFQYEIGKTYEENDKEIEICCSGFHFCLNLNDVMEYYNYAWNNFTNRYFKVKGLVRKSDYQEYGRKMSTRINYLTVVNKLVAKSITILEEIPKEEIWEKFIEPNANNYWYITKERYLLENKEEENTENWIRKTIFEDIYTLDITSEEITSMIVEKIYANVNSNTARYALGEIHKELKILNDLDCGKDMKCYLFCSIYSKYIFTSNQGNSF